MVADLVPAPVEAVTWPNISRASHMFGVSVATMSRWADDAEVGRFINGERVLRPKELLRIAERQVRRLFDVTERIFDFAHEATKDEEVRRSVRTEVNEYLADYQRRRDPARMVSLAEVLEELRKAFPRAQFERVRARLEAQDLPKRADMFSAEPGEKEKRQARPRRRRAAVG